MKKLISIWILLFVTVSTAHARGSADYQIGSEWGKRPVRAADLEKANPEFRRAALATARVGGATGFYLGKFNGRHVMATNHHVLENQYQCIGTTIIFPMLDMRGRCTEFFGSWTDIDLALFVITIDAKDEAKLAPVGANFAFHKDVYAGQALMTLGFGVAENPARQLMANQDSDCKVFSDARDYHFMADPDALNPGTYSAWSFANGCDVSHGDSGSAMVDRATGEVVGIIWTGKIPKSAKIQDSNYLRQLLESRGGEIWTELSYAVPAVKMSEFLDNLVRSGTSLSQDARTAIIEMLR